MLFAPDRQWFPAMSLMKGREIPMIFFAVLTTLGTVLRSVLLQLPDQTEMLLIKMLFIVPPQT